MLPTSFILDREGRVRYRILGDMEWDNDREVEEILAALLRED
jgi:peroxiredoxin